MTGTQIRRGQLASKAVVRLGGGCAILLTMLLGSAGTLAYWEAWVYMAIVLVPLMVILVLLLVNDPELLERRMRTKERAARQTMVLLGYGLFAAVLRENSYASRVVEVETGQRVVTTGPYAIVRHPMYLGVLVMFLATPVALGSWWAVIPALPLIAVLVARILSEERLLAEELTGYEEYIHITRYRLVPGLW